MGVSSTEAGEVRGAILRALAANPGGLTSTYIASAIARARGTADKYLEELRAAGVVETSLTPRKVGSRGPRATLYVLAGANPSSSQAPQGEPSALPGQLPFAFEPGPVLELAPGEEIDQDT